MGSVVATANISGTAAAGSAIQIVFPAPVTSVLALTVSPAIAGVTSDLSGSTFNIRFGSAAAIPSGTSFRVDNIRLDVSQLAVSSGGTIVAQGQAVPSAAFSFLNPLTIIGRSDLNTCPVTLMLSSELSSIRVPNGCLGPADVIVVSGVRNFAMPTLVIATADGGTWINNGNVTVAGQDNSYTISIAPTTTGLPIGKYSGTIKVVAPNTTNSPVITVSLTITTGEPMKVNSPSMIFRSSVGVDPPPQTLTVSVLIPEAIPTVAVETLSPAGGNWLNVAASRSGNTLTLTVTATAAGLSPTPLTLPYAGLIKLSSDLSVELVRNIIVQFQVDSQGPAINLAQTKLDFTSPAGSSTATSLPANVGSTSGSLSFTAAAATDRGGNWLTVNPTSATAPGTMTVTANPTGLAPGFYSGTITVSNSPQKIAVTLMVGTVPKIADRGIKQGASFSDGNVAAGTILSLFGSNLATGTQAAATLPLPAELSGAQVKVNGTAAPLYYVSPGQINFQLPSEVSGTSVTVVPSLNSVDGPPVIVDLLAAAPGLFSRSSDGTGSGVILKSDFSVVSTSNPAARGSAILIYGTGFGATAPAVASGQIAPGDSGLAKLLATPSVTIGGLPAQVSFAGLAPGFVGLFQINAVIPAGISAGNADVSVTINGVASNAVIVAVQ